MILGFILRQLLKQFFHACFINSVKLVEFSRNFSEYVLSRKGGWKRKGQLVCFVIFSARNAFWNAYGNNYQEWKRRAIFTPREFFERPAVPFIVFHLLDTVQSIHASLKIPLPARCSNSKQSRSIPSLGPLLEPNLISKFHRWSLPISNERKRSSRYACFFFSYMRNPPLEEYSFEFDNRDRGVSIPARWK